MIYNIFYDIILNKNEIIIIKRPNCRRIIFDICSLCLALSLSLNICVKNYFAVFEMQSLSIFCIYIERISKIFSLFCLSSQCQAKAKRISFIIKANIQTHSQKNQQKVNKSERQQQCIQRIR